MRTEDNPISHNERITDGCLVDPELNERSPEERSERIDNNRCFYSVIGMIAPLDKNIGIVLKNTGNSIVWPPS